MLNKILVTAAALAMAAQPALADASLDRLLGVFPAHVQYLADDSPFVLFDVAPRTLVIRPGSPPPSETTLSFVAADSLASMSITTFAVSSRQGNQASLTRTACGAKIAGYYQCTVPTQEALALLNGGDGVLGLRIEAEGLDGDRSHVEVTLPVMHVAAEASGKAAAKPARRSTCCKPARI
jgi:hypothetical protein